MNSPKQKKIFNTNALLLLLLPCLLLSRDVFAVNMGVFVINFSISEGKDTVQRVFDQQSVNFDKFVIIDAGELSLIGYFDHSIPDLGSLADNQFTVAERYRARSPTRPINLARILNFVADVLRVNAKVASKIDVYLINSLFHEDGQFKFVNGYPNDGFLFLDDSEFGYIQRLTLQNIRLHVLATSSTEFKKTVPTVFFPFRKRIV